MGTPGKRADVDWERIEAQYRAGIMSTREIATEHGISHTAINKRAKAEDWARDLAAKVRARAEQLVSRALVSNEVSSKRAATEKETVEIEAQVRSRIELRQRSDVSAARDLCQKLLAELGAQCANTELLDELGELIGSQSEEKLQEAFYKVVGFTGRVGSMKALTEALKNLVALERTAYRMDVPVDPMEAAGKQFSELELAAKMAYFLDLGRRRQAEAAE